VTAQAVYGALWVFAVIMASVTFMDALADELKGRRRDRS